MDRVPIPISDDVDLEALMLRVRDAARAGTAAGGSPQTQAVRDDIARELDLIHVLEAQGDWNEQARQTFMALTDGLRALRDDWAEVHAGLRREIAELSALVEQLRSPSRTRRAATSSRGGGKRRPAGKRRPRG